MNTDAYMVGIDVGTTGTKVVVFDMKSNVISKAYREYSTINIKPGWVEQDAKLLVEKTLDACREALGRVNADQIQSLGLSTQRCCAIFIDQNGDPMKMFSWQDCRAEKEIEKIRETISDDDFYKLSGLPLNAAWLLPKIMWVQKNEPELYKKTDRVVQLHDLILKRLGADDYYTSVTDVGFYCVWDTDKCSWDEGLISRLGVDRQLMSKVAPTGTEIGRVTQQAAAETGLPVGLKLTVSAGDETCACIGAGVVYPGALSVDMGTGGMLLGFLDKPYRDPNRAFMIVNHPIDGCYELEGWQKGAAGVFRWFRDEIATHEVFEAKRLGIDPYLLLDDLIERAPAGSGGLVVMPYFATAGTPRWNDDARGTIFGLSYAHDRACLARAFVEGITFEIKDMIACMRSSNLTAESACIIGGTTKCEEWNQIQADIYGIPVHVPIFEDASILGGAIIGAYGVGLFSSIPDAVKEIIRVKKQYEPIPKNVRLYEELYDVYVSVYEGLDNSGAFKKVAAFQKR
ncbi:MAG: FGGY family carbohydrate kinase [Eubacteriales bacterium]|nr:FGGY family carbohydrate kinase [Eubacteriales bacterium]